tara:strand:+ start:651 stop:1043 length:393 start_codon:yes stop_codon:yes gene_type:complete
MSEQISILKLKDGSTLVGKVSTSGDIVEIEYPIELVSNVMTSTLGLGEQINLRPWVAISEETTFTIERYNIITIATLQENFKEGYNRMVDTIYINPPDWDGPMTEEEVETSQDLDTLAELAEAVIKNKIH